MKLQNNLNRTFLFLVLFIGSTMFCMAQNICNMNILSFNGGFQDEGNGKTGLFSLNTADAGERTWQGEEIPLRKLSFSYGDYYDFVLNIAITLGWDINSLDYEFGGKNIFIGGEVEFRFFSFLGVQTGLEVLPNIDYSFYEPLVTNAIIQIPVLAEFNLPLEFYQISIYGGIGINLLSINNDRVLVKSFSKFSYIFGGKWSIAISNLNISMAYQYNCDFSDTMYRYLGDKYNYLPERSFVYIGVGWYIPLD